MTDVQIPPWGPELAERIARVALEMTALAMALPTPQDSLTAVFLAGQVLSEAIDARFPGLRNTPMADVAHSRACSYQITSSPTGEQTITPTLKE